MKSITLTAALFCILFSNAFAQKYFTTTLRTNSGQEVFSLDSADYIMVVSEPDSGSNMFNVKQYYKDKTIKLAAKSKSNREIAYDGQVQTFYPSGKKHELSTYVAGNRVGDSYEYFPNGKIYAHKKYLPADNSGTAKELLLDCRDSTGTVLASNGEGRFKVYGENFSFVFEEGTVKDGLKDGEWKGNNNDKAHAMSFTEQYEKGALKSGMALYGDDNKTYTYTSRYVPAEYPGGDRAFARFIELNVVYPPIMRAMRTQAQLIMQFTIQVDGTLSDFKTVHSPNTLFTEEAVNVLKKSPKWKPAYAFGKLVTSTYTVPVNFAM